MEIREVNNVVSKSSFWTKNKNLLINLTKIIIAAGLLIYIISFINLRDIINAIEQANIYLILLSFLLSFVNVYLQFYKWKITANVILQEKHNSKVWLSLFYGFSAGVFTPARIGEYFGRALVFKNKSLLQVTLATLLDKIFPLFVITFLGSISSILFIYYNYRISYLLTISLFIVLFLLFYFVLILIFNDKFWEGFIFTRLKDSQKLKWLFEKIKVFRNLDKKYATKMFIFSGLFYLCFVLQYAILVAAFSNHSNYLIYLWAGTLMIFTKTVIPPVSLGELGIREGASIFFITQFGELSTTGFNASIFLFIINILIPSVIGLFLLLKKSND